MKIKITSHCLAQAKARSWLSSITKSGEGRATEAVARLRDEPGHGYECIVSVGGDGTVFEVHNANFGGASLPMAHIPCGTYVAFAVLLRANAGAPAPDKRGYSSPVCPTPRPDRFRRSDPTLC